MGREFKKTRRGRAVDARSVNCGGNHSPFSFDPILAPGVWLLEDGVETGESQCLVLAQGPSLGYCPGRGVWFYHPDTCTEDKFWCQGAVQ